MVIVLKARTPCHLCGYLLRDILTATARINKRSIGRARGGLGFRDRQCPECATPAAGQPTVRRYRLTADSAAEVHAYRLRRWPELARETA